MNDQLYLSSMYGNVPVTILEVYRDTPKSILMANVEVTEDLHPYEKGDTLRTPYSNIVHFDLCN